MTQVVASNTNNIVKVYSVGVQGAPGPSGSLQPSNSGSFSITGSLIVSGSNTFTNIGLAIFSGSVVSTGGFTGSLAGTAATASFVTTAQTASFVNIAQTASFVTTAQTASYISPTFISSSAAASGFGVSVNTGSLMVTGSVSSNTLTFTKGDGSTFNLTVNTGSSGTIPTLAQVTAQGSTTGNVLTIQGMTFKSGSTFPGITANSTFIGYQSGDNSDNNAAFNVGVGYRTLFNNNTGQNVALGARSLENGISGENIGIGYLSGNNIKGPQNIGIGNGTLQYAYSASQNIAIGTTALPFAASTETEASSNKEGNIAIGYAALATAVRGRYNTIIGTSAYTTIANLGNQNTSLGYLNSTSGSYNITIGTSNTLSGYGEYNIVIGNTNSFTNLSNSVIIGNAGNIKFRSTGSVTTLFEDTVISGSLTVSGSEVLTLVPVSPLPSGVAAGSFAVSGSTPPRPYFFDGTSWVALI